MKYDRKFWLRTAITSAAAMLVVSALYAANNIGPYTVCTFDTTGANVHSACVTPVDTHGLSVVGGTPGTALSAASNNATLVKASAGMLTKFNVVNTTATAVDLRFYNTATTPSGGAPCNAATNLVWNVPIQANTTSAGINLPIDTGLYFSTGIVFCLTLNNTNTDNTNAVTGINMNWSYN